MKTIFSFIAMIGLSYIGYGQCRCSSADLFITNNTNENFCVEIYEEGMTSSGCPELNTGGPGFCTSVPVAANSTACVSACSGGARNISRVIVAADHPTLGSCFHCPGLVTSQTVLVDFNPLGSLSNFLYSCGGYNTYVDFTGCAICGGDYDFNNTLNVDIHN